MVGKKQQVGQVTQGDGKRPIVLVVLHDGVKDFVYALGAFRWLKDNFENADIVLLTSRGLRELGLQSGYFKHVWVDPMYEWWEIHKWWKFRKQMRNLNIKLFIDLQHSERTRWYFKLFGRDRPSWSGTESWCSFPYRIPDRADAINPSEFVEPHILTNYAEQLSVMGFEVYPEDIQPDLSWVTANISRFKITSDYILLAPIVTYDLEHLGWDINTVAEFIDLMHSEYGLRTVLIGQTDEDGFVKRLLRRCASADPLNLVAQLSFTQVAELAKGAEFTLGNDRGELYITAHVGCPTVFLFSMLSSVSRTVPHAFGVRVIQDANISGISLQYVVNVLDALLTADGQADQYQAELEAAEYDDAPVPEKPAEESGDKQTKAQSKPKTKPKAKKPAEDKK